MPLVLEWGEETDSSSVRETESAFSLVLLLLVLMCINSIVVLVQKLHFKIAKWWLLRWVAVVSIVGAHARVPIVGVPATRQRRQVRLRWRMSEEVECVVCI